MHKTVNVIGMGYIGLPTALMLAANKVSVVGSDIDVKKIEKLKNGEMTFSEKGLSQLYLEAKKNSIIFQTEPSSADIYIISVPTPYNKKNRTVSADYLISAADMVLPRCKNDSIVVIESTVSPGTIEKYLKPMVEERNRMTDAHISLVHAPERIIPGNMISELENNSRIIGADQKDAGDTVKELYSKFCKGKIIITNIKTAELSKVAENTFRDINIAYANELVKICREAGVDVYELINIANMHPRVNILSPGPGVGGHCISVDPWFLVGDYPEIANLILTSRRVNDSMPNYVLGRISEIMKENGINSLSEVGLYGLTYKENVDDIRESPTLQLLSCMGNHAAFGIKVYDPYITTDIVSGQYHEFNSFLNDIKMIVIMVGHDEIRNNEEKLKQKIVFDTRNVTENIENKYIL